MYYMEVSIGSHKYHNSYWYQSTSTWVSHVSEFLKPAISPGRPVQLLGQIHSRTASSKVARLQLAPINTNGVHMIAT